MQKRDTIVVKVDGKGGISATIVADSISEGGVRITTYELEYPRFIHSEFMTHRQFSRNAASSRAIPIAKVIEQVETNPAMPIHWGKNQSGMQAKEELVGPELATVKNRVETLGRKVTGIVRELSKWGLHKQISNRYLEPYQMIKVVCTATEYDNFFYLRNHSDAQPEIAELARCMLAAMGISEPQELGVGDWHLPYLRAVDGVACKYYYCDKVGPMRAEEAIKISASLCAQVSYRKSDESLEKALKIYDQLVTMKPVHASPFEHQATPAKPQMVACKWQEGLTHMDKDGYYWSGNFKGWIQNRQLIKGHVYNES